MLVLSRTRFPFSSSAALRIIKGHRFGDSPRTGTSTGSPVLMVSFYCTVVS